MVQEAAEAFQADVPKADVLVAVEAGAEGGAGIVGVNEVDVGEAEQLVGAAEGGAEAGRAGDIEAGGEEVAGVEAEADGEFGERAGEIADGPELFKAAAELTAGAGGVFEEDGETGGGEAAGGVAEAEGKGGDALLDGLAAVAAGVDNQVLGADGGGALDLGAEAGDGAGADEGIEGGEVDEIVDVDGERAEVVALADFLQQADLAGVGRACAPHARAGGEDLEGVGAELDGLEGRLFEGTGGEGVDAEAQGDGQGRTPLPGSYMLSDRLSPAVRCSTRREVQEKRRLRGPGWRWSAGGGRVGGPAAQATGYSRPQLGQM